jgi:hypothetical protein
MKPQHEKPFEFEQLILSPGILYRVILEFRDVDCKSHHPGEEWTFLGYDFFPYDAAYTLFVSSRLGVEEVIRLQDDPQEQKQILKSFNQYIALA